MPQAHSVAPSKKDTHIIVDTTYKGITFKDVNDNKTAIEPETLEEQVLYFADNGEYTLKTFKYLYDITHEKLYYDDNANNFFTIDAKTRKRRFIDTDTKIGDTNSKYRSISVLWGEGDKKNITEYKKIYQLLNKGKNQGRWCIDIDPDNATREPDKKKLTEIKTDKLEELGFQQARFKEIYKDFSAINYYVESYAFTNWVNNHLGNKAKLLQVQKKVDNTLENKEIQSGIFKISKNNNPEDPDSDFSQHKKEIMRDNVTTNLNLAISNYNGPGETTYKLPKLTDSDWEQLFSNISLITFFQGVPIGLKTYNNYSIATSTTNREYVDPGELYFSGADPNYHRVFCEKCQNITYTGYRSVEYVQKEFNKGDGNIYFYQHDSIKDGNSNSETACYYCAINKANYKQTSDKNIAYSQAKSYNEALARERYYQKEKVTGKTSITIIYEGNMLFKEVEKVIDVPEPQEADTDEPTTLSSLKPKAIMKNPNQKTSWIFSGWSRDSQASEPDPKYKPGSTLVFTDQDVDTNNEVHLYAVWKPDLSSFDWCIDCQNGISEINFGTKPAKTEDDYETSYVHMVGNRDSQGKGAAWTTLESDFLVISEINFEYNLNAGHSFNGGGLLFFVKDDNPGPENQKSGTLDGYMLSINLNNEMIAAGQNNNVAIFKFKYIKGQNTSHFPGVCSGDHSSTSTTPDLKFLGGTTFANFDTSVNSQRKRTYDSKN